MGSCFSKDKKIAKQMLVLSELQNAHETNLNLLNNTIKELEEQIRNQKGKPSVALTATLFARRTDAAMLQEEIQMLGLLRNSEQQHTNIPILLRDSQRQRGKMWKLLGKGGKNDTTSDLVDRYREKQEKYYEEIVQRAVRATDSHNDQLEVQQAYNTELEEIKQQSKAFELELEDIVPENDTLRLLKREAPPVPTHDHKAQLKDLFSVIQ